MRRFVVYVVKQKENFFREKIAIYHEILYNKRKGGMQDECKDMVG